MKYIRINDSVKKVDIIPEEGSYSLKENYKTFTGKKQWKVNKQAKLDDKQAT